MSINVVTRLQGSERHRLWGSVFLYQLDEELPVFNFP